MQGWMRLGIPAALAAFILMAGSAQIAELQAAGDDIKERRALMKDNSKANKVVRAFVKKGQGSADEVAAAGKRIAANAAKLAGLFPTGTSLADALGKTRAKPDIWLQFAKFKTKAGDLKAASENLTRVAASGDAAAIKAAAGGIGKVCGSCHKAFRGPKIKKKK
ncbi:MAG: c-type cytochrome [Alphaproteobacteria bacterium]